MGSKSFEALRAFTDPPPADLVEFYDRGRLPRDESLGINFLSLSDACEQTEMFRQLVLSPSLDPFVLDDANDSNPHLLVAAGVLNGMVIHYLHDGDRYVRFPSLAEFVAAAERCVATGLSLDDVKPARIVHPDQTRLKSEVLRFAGDDSDDAEFHLLLMIPLLEDDSVGELDSLARHRSFFVREAVGNHVTKVPLALYSDIARRLTEDRHAQVKSAGARAEDALRRAKV